MNSSSTLDLFESSSELFVAALGGVLLLSILLGRIRIRGLLLDGDTPSAAKLQLFIISLTVAFEYAMTIARTPTPSRLPPLNDTLLTLGAASNALFLVQGVFVRLKKLGS